MKTYLVIGGSSGIGREICQSLSSEGHRVLATYCNTPTQNTTIEYHHLDVMNGSTYDFVPEQLDGLVYCPGAISLKPFKRLKTEEIINDLCLQVFGFIDAFQQLLPNLQQSQSASVVSFSSIAVSTGFNFHTQIGISKGAMEGLVRSLSAEFAPKIRVNAIAPSLTNTPLAERLLNTEAKIQANAERHPLKRIGNAEDIAQAACFLLSEKSSWITGQIMNVDGGLSSIKL